ncbi:MULTISPECIES: (Fe-S)-binding protein [Cytobacillus]|uniref:Glycolate oxidase iron-sulfur subunit n=1 Tax=Cytobacillus kochii TaxID=859143 RepID=A0A248TMK1_9BACI|nr:MULTISPECIES: (Fe-S)-binding protein [Cytobacillus]ASV69443.1 glycolate oxidase [Cytobacillus kochii]MCA1028265.1 (Fe-S)-binding protein [Cytobacillus kochii]MCM3321049.1 (Fe-S)-binding protein [Cytobacillus kochii]MCM3344118.1 (Fe-S)-binding protein [Cytobacillus kochii]MDM5207962.1 (Fe-S)-binding protein [Cytobacillus kochii]
MTVSQQKSKQPACKDGVSNYLWNDAPDETKWADCVHCGMCLESCPTYEQTGQEQHSPRGRVYLIKSVAEGKLTVNEEFMDPVFACLDCRACTTACPADVDVGGLIEEARGQVRQAIPLKGWKKSVNKLFLHGIFPHENRLQTLGGLLKFYQKSGMQTLVRKTKLIQIMPKHLVDMEGVMPKIHSSVKKKHRNGSVIKAKQETKREVAMLTGCVMDVMFSDVNESTINVLTRNGNDVHIPQNQTCCGALHVHAGDRDMGRKLAKQNILAFENDDTVIVNAAGCGCMMKEYGELFKEEPEWREKAEALADKVEDISKFLYDTGYEKPKASLNKRITYHDACHLAHGQGVREEPRDLLLNIPGVEMVHMPNADRCCGSAGIYNITNPEMAGAVLASKMENVPDDVEMISMGNPGCMLQMAIGVKNHGRSQKVVHTVQLLDWAYQKESRG